VCVCVNIGTGERSLLRDEIIIMRCVAAIFTLKVLKV